MTTKLLQKQFLKGIRECEIIDDAIVVRIKTLLKEEKLTIGLDKLNPEPVVNGSLLEFHGRIKSEPLFSLFLNNPNAEEFNTFVDTLKQRVREENNDLLGSEVAASESSQNKLLRRNIYEEPPEFKESEQSEQIKASISVNADRIDKDITMLKTYLDENNIQPLLTALEALKAEPENEAAFQRMVEAFNGLGFHQGAILTYAPYLKVLLSQTIWS